MADFGIKISRKDKDVKTSSGLDTFFDGKYPFVKLDRTKPASFQDIRITFSNNVPVPVPGSGSTTTTNVYQFAHGYSYKPQVWAMGQRIAEPSTAIPGYPYFIYFHKTAELCNFGTIVRPTLEIWHDINNVYVTVKIYDAFGLPGYIAPDLRGLILQLRVFVFAEDITSTNLY